jgi:plasmid stability protein
MLKATEVSMAQLIVRKLDDAVKRKLKRRAAANGSKLGEKSIVRLPEPTNTESRPAQR